MQGNSPLTCPILVGRNREVAAVERVLNGAAAGGCAVAAVTGEPGIGKTRLVRDIEERALRRGFLVLTGQCREQDPDFPFAPFSDALHQFLASR